MRLFVLILAFLAGAKVWTQDSLFRAGAEEALVAAYREQAIDACQKQTRTLEGEPVKGVAWRQAEPVRMMTGSRRVKVQFWQVDHELWGARFRNPYLVLGGGEPASPRDGLACEFDLLYGQATIVRL